MNENEQEYLAQQEGKTKEEHIRDFLRVALEVEEQIAPFKDHLKELKKNYKEHGWLDSDDFKIITKLKNLAEDNFTLDQIQEYWNYVQEGRRRV